MPRSCCGGFSEIELEAECVVLAGLAPMALLAAVLSAVNDAADEMSKLDRVPTVERLSSMLAADIVVDQAGVVDELGRSSIASFAMGASGAEAQVVVGGSCLRRGVFAAASPSFFSAPTASTIPALARLPPKALGMNALTLGGKRDRIEVNLPGSEDAGGSGAAETGRSGTRGYIGACSKCVETDARRRRGAALHVLERSCSHQPTFEW